MSALIWIHLYNRLKTINSRNKKTKVKNLNKNIVTIYSKGVSKSRWTFPRGHCLSLDISAGAAVFLSFILSIPAEMSGDLKIQRLRGMVYCWIVYYWRCLGEKKAKGGLLGSPHTNQPKLKLFPSRRCFPSFCLLSAIVLDLHIKCLSFQNLRRVCLAGEPSARHNHCSLIS